MQVDELTGLDTDELEEQFAWFDWREDDRALVETFRSRLEDASSLGCVETENGITVRYRGESHAIPLTDTGSDRYVVLCSLAELLKDTHDVWLNKPFMEGDTHGFLVLTKSQSGELAEKHTGWVEQWLQPLNKGIDEFSGLKIPYLGHEERAAEFERAHRALEEAREARDAGVQVFADQAEDAIRKHKRSEYLGLAIAVLILVAIAWALMAKHSAADCDVQVNGECIEP